MDMSEATQQFKLQLGIEDGSQINLRDRASILEAFKQNATFTLKKKEYEGILSRIKADNTVLQDLSRVSRELELDRRRRSQSRLTKLLRGLFQSIYSALCSAITCACVYSHSIGLQLAHRDVIILPLDVEEKVAERFDFCITLRTLEAGNEYKTMRIGQPVNEAQLVSHWENFQLRLMHAEKLPLTSTTLSLTSATPSPKPKVSWASSVSFMLSNIIRSTMQPLTQPPILPQTTTKSTEVAPPRVSDLCNIARRGSKAPAVNCYGYVLDAPHKFVLSHPNDDNKPQKHMTLRQVIERHIPDLPPFGFKDKLQVALALSVSVLHLDGTPWLAQIVTLDDIVFMVGDENTINQRPCLFSRPFVIKSVSNTTSPQCATLPTPTSPQRTTGVARPINLAVLALGALLIQIMIERVDDGLRVTGTMDIGSIVSKRERGRQLEEEVLVNGGMNYAAAVKWCLDGIYGVAGLQNDRFCQRFYEAVVARLEDDLKVITSDA